MSKLPKAWERSNLGVISYINMGQSPKGEYTNIIGEGLPLVGGASDFSELYPRPKKHTSSPTKTSQKGDVLLCIRATIGKVNVADREYCLGRGVAGFRPILVNQKWLVNFLSGVVN